MKSPRLFKLWLAIGSAAAILSLRGQSASAATFNDGGPPTDDTTSSIAAFRIAVRPEFEDALRTTATTFYVGYTSADKRLKSPALFDSATRIGRSSPHNNNAEPATVLVGSAAQPFTSSDFLLVPPAFSGAGPNREVYTSILEFNLQFNGESCKPRQGDTRVADPADPNFPYVSGQVLVKAGSLPSSGGGMTGGIGMRSPGQIQAISTSGAAADDLDLPGAGARSFFNVSVEVTLPPSGGVPEIKLRNTAPMLLENAPADPLRTLPPTVVYIHGGSSAVPVYFQSSGVNAASGKAWNAGDLFGYLVLAGHGVITGGCTTEKLNSFLDEVFGPIGNPRPELPIPGGPATIPTVSEWGLIVLTLLLLSVGTIVLRRRKASAGLGAA